MAFTHRFQSIALAGVLTSGIIGVGTFGAITTARAQGTSPIGVTVDGNQVSFNRTQPVELHGSVLVPLRGVFEALGADVDYDSQTATVTATKGDRTVVVPIGSATATIDGQPQNLSQPAQIYNGSTMVPLRFVAEAFGDYVEWGAQTHVVSITTIQPSLNVAALPSAVDNSAESVDSSRVVGVVRQVITDTSPHQIVVRVSGQDRMIPVADTATILRGRIGRDGHSIALRDIQAGDRVVIHQNDDGAAVRIASTFGLVYGTVSSVEIRASGHKAIILNDGQRIELAPSARVMRDGQVIAAADLNVGDHLTIATDPDDNIAYRISVDPPINAHRR